MHQLLLQSQLGKYFIRFYQNELLNSISGGQKNRIGNFIHKNERSVQDTPDRPKAL